MRRCLNGCARQLIGHVPDPPRIQKDTEIASPAYTRCACQVDELGIPDTEQSRWVAVRMGPGPCVHCPLFSPRTGTSALRRSSAVLCKAEVLRWILDESLSKTAQEPHGLPSIAADIAVRALTARSEAGAIGVIVEPFHAGLRFVPGERNLGVAGLPAGAVWIGDFEAWRRVAAFTLSKLRMGVDAGILLCALSDGSATALTGGSLLRRK